MNNTYTNSYLGFDSRNGQFLISTSKDRYEVNPGEFVRIIARPQIPFQCRNLFIDSLSSRFLIHNIQIGNNGISAADTVIPAECFITKFDKIANLQAIFDECQKKGNHLIIKIDQIASDLLTEFILPTCQPSQDMILDVENIGVLPCRFLAGMIGRVIEY